MPHYRYKARSRAGTPVTGIMEADDLQKVSQWLSRQGYIPISVSPLETQTSFFAGLLRPVPLSDLALFTRQLWTMQRAGIPLLTSLTTLRDQMRNRAFRGMLVEIIRDLEAGSSLSGAMGRFPDTFGALYVNMVRAGEASGKLDEVLVHLIGMLDFELSTRGRVKSALLYPVITFITLIGAFIAIVTFVVPRFISLYSQFGADLPLATRVLLLVSTLFRNHWLEVFMGLAALIFAVRYALNVPAIRFRWDLVKIRIPVFGPLFFNITMSRFARSLSELLSSGVPVLQALQLVADTVGNLAVRKAVLDIQKSVNEGKGMTEPMRQSGFFSPVTIQMVAVGEQSGKTEELLNFVSQYYEEIASNMVKNLTTLIEPIMAVIIGFFVLVLATGVFLPLWDVVKVLN